MTFIKRDLRTSRRENICNCGILFYFYNKLLHFSNVLLIEITCGNAWLGIYMMTESEVVVWHWEG